MYLLPLPLFYYFIGGSVCATASTPMFLAVLHWIFSLCKATKLRFMFHVRMTDILKVSLIRYYSILLVSILVFAIGNIFIYYHYCLGGGVCMFVFCTMINIITNIYLFIYLFILFNHLFTYYCRNWFFYIYILGDPICNIEYHAVLI
jgi:hypothetical protein